MEKKQNFGTLLGCKGQPQRALLHPSSGDQGERTFTVQRALKNNYWVTNIPATVNKGDS
jgi:hypothetical protein